MASSFPSQSFHVMLAFLAALHVMALESNSHPRHARDIARCKACRETVSEIRTALKRHDHKHKLKVTTLDLVKEMNGLCQKHRNADKQVPLSSRQTILNFYSMR